MAPWLAHLVLDFRRSLASDIGFLYPHRTSQAGGVAARGERQSLPCRDSEAFRRVNTTAATTASQTGLPSAATVDVRVSSVSENGTEAHPSNVL